MRILVTGGHGWIGGAVCRLLRAQGDELFVFDRSNGNDVCDLKVVAEAAEWCDAIINLAGMLGTSEMFGAEGDAVRVNTLGAVNVYDAAAIWKLPVVQIGTGHKGQPNPYAISKAAAEDLGLARAKYLHEPINVVRAYHAYGPGQKAAPPHGKSPVCKIIPTFICDALTGRPLQINGSGNQFIDLVYVDDVAEVLIEALQPPYGRVIEAGTGVGRTVKSVADDIRFKTDSGSDVEYVPMRPGEPEDTTVVATDPACHNAWPYRLEGTIDYYRELIDASPVA